MGRPLPGGPFSCHGSFFLPWKLSRPIQVNRNMYMPRHTLFLAALLPLTACASRPGVGELRPAEVGNIVESESGALVTVDSIAALASSADVLLFGEIHDDSVAHRIQLELAQSLAARGTSVILGLEMFGRDVQAILDEPGPPGMPLHDFLERSRAWANYPTDYAPVVAVARSQGWRVIGTNLPQPQATLVARQGLPALQSLPLEERPHAAAENICPRDEYWNRFIAELTEESDSAAHADIVPDDPVMSRMFEAQCARDEAMAEAIAEAAADETLVYHLNGSFHSDYGLGIVPRLRRRRPELRILTISVVPRDDFMEGGLTEYGRAADFLVITPSSD
jgi:uncharacterized iron-regulated protein